MLNDIYTFEEAFKEERGNNQGLILNTRGADD